MNVPGGLSFAWLLLPPAPIQTVMERFTMAPSSLPLCSLHLRVVISNCPLFLLLTHLFFLITYLPY